MKKLMIAACAVAFAAVAQAATVNWTQTKSTLGDGAGGDETDVIAQNTAAYLIQVTSDHTAAKLIEILAQDGKTIADVSSAIASWQVDEGVVNSSHKINRQGGKTDKLTAGADEYAFMAIIIDDRVYVSSNAKATYSESGGDKVYSFAFTLADANASWEDTMSAKDYAGAGWYNAAAIPEPTSGLLLLLGVAGLALRRRRA